MKNERYQFDDYYCFPKNDPDNHLNKQLGDFGEQLIMTILGRMKQYKVFQVDHEGADLIAVDPFLNQELKYAISVKTHQFGIEESQNFEFKQTDQIKLTKFAKDFNAIPVVAEVLIAKDFSFVDIFIIKLKDFMDLADIGTHRCNELLESGILKSVSSDTEHQYSELAIKWAKGQSLSLNNYVWNAKEKKYEDNAYTKYLYNNSRIHHMRMDMCNRLRNEEIIGTVDTDIDVNLLKMTTNTDNNLNRQLGDFGEFFMMFAFSHLKKYKVARVNHVGIDLIASKPGSKQKPYAISVKTNYKSGSKHIYNANEISKIVNISNDLNYIPAVAYILPRKASNPEVFDCFFMTLDTLVRYNNDMYTIYPELYQSKNLEPTYESFLEVLKDTNVTLEINNDEFFREYVESHPEIERMEMRFPVRFK